MGNFLSTLLRSCCHCYRGADTGLTYDVDCRKMSMEVLGYMYTVGTRMSSQTALRTWKIWKIWKMVSRKRQLPRLIGYAIRTLSRFVTR